MKKLILCLSTFVLLSGTVFAQNKSDLQAAEKIPELKDSKLIFEKYQLSKKDLEQIERFKNLEFDTLNFYKEYLKEYSKYKDLNLSFPKDTIFNYEKEAKKYENLARNLNTKLSYKYNMPIYKAESLDEMPTLEVKSEDKMPILNPKKDNE